MRPYEICRSLLLAVLLATAGGCEILEPLVGPTVCTDEARPGIALTIRAAQGGGPDPEDIRVVLREGEYTEEAMVYRWPGSPYPGASGAYERAGTYEVSVKAPGYRTWTASRVRVTEDACHVRTVGLNVTLQPEA